MKKKICLLLSGGIVLILSVSCIAISFSEKKKEFIENDQKTYEEAAVYEYEEQKEKKTKEKEKVEKMNIQESQIHEENINACGQKDNRDEISEEESDSSLKISKIHSFANENSEILPLSVDEEGECFVDLNSYSGLKNAVETDQVKYEEKIHNLTSDDEDVIVNTYIQRADNKIYSFFKVAFTGKEGGKRCIDFEGLNYEVDTGKTLLLEDIVKDQNKLVEVVMDQIELLCRDKLYSIESSMAVKEIFDTDNKVWNIGYQGLVFYIDMSSQENKNVKYIPVMVSFAEYPWLFWDNCMQVPEQYAVEVGINSLFFYDMDGNGKDEEIRVWYEEKSDNQSIDKIIIQIGNLEKTIKCNEDNDLSEELVGSDLRCHILHVGNKKSFLYIHTSTFMDDMEYSYVLGMNASEIRIINKGMLAVIEGGPLLDPQNIIGKENDVLLSGVWYFSTISCQKIDQNGQFSKKEEVEYYQSNDFGVEVISELKVDRIALSDENILESNIELPIGMVLEPIRTNHETYIDFVDKNENIYRIKFEISVSSESEKMVTIQGKPVSDYLGLEIGFGNFEAEEEKN